MGELEVLSVGRGDLKLTITNTNKAEVEKARQTITDMLRRGYAIFVEVPDPKDPMKRELRRVQRFDPKKMEYIISEIAPEDEAKPKPRPIRTRGIPVTKSRAHAVGRASGG